MTLGGEAISIKKSPAKKKKLRIIESTTDVSLRKKGQLDSFIKKQNKKKSGNFLQLVVNKDFSSLNQKVDVKKAATEYFDELKPHQYYDEVIADFFGGNLFDNDEFLKDRQVVSKQSEEELNVSSSEKEQKLK